MTKARQPKTAGHQLPPRMVLHAAPREKLADTVARQLLDLIASLAPGARLPALDELASQLGVSRLTVREALRGLATLGMVDIRHGSGVYVTGAGNSGAVLGSESLSPELLRELLEARQIVEVEVAGLAAERHTAADEKALVAVLTEHHQQLTAGGHPVIPSSEFHARLLSAAGNRVLEGYLSSFFRLMINQGPGFFETFPGSAAEDYAQHRAILEAIRSRSADVARLRMKEHLVCVSGYYLQSVAP